MQTLLLMRGSPGSGKSTWIKENGLDTYTLEPDRIRLMMQSPITDIYGKKRISQKNDKNVWALLFGLLEEKMKRGEFVVIDGTHSRSQLINTYRKLARRYRYRVYVKDVGKDLSLQEIHERNKLRKEYKRVPENVIDMMYYRIQNEKLPSWVTEITRKEELFITPLELSQYNKLNIIGDIHGSYDALKHLIIKDDEYYIFTGDYFDRGIENDKVFKYLYYIKDNKNVLMLKGNHEKHIDSYLNDLKIPTHARKSIKQILESGVTNKELKEFYYSLGQMAYVKYKDKYIVCTHGGITNVPSVFDHTIEFVNGVGRYPDADIVAETFNKSTFGNTYSVHGHRNFIDDLEQIGRVYNLTGNAEFGGYSHHLIIDENGFTRNKYKNNVYDNELVKRKLEKQTPKETYETTNDIFGMLEKDPGIKLKKLDDGVYSANFTKKVFRTRQWDHISTKTRGLFLTKSGEIIARSYNKFFNWNEMPETSDKWLQDNLKYPIEIKLKENGFLGMLSVYNNEWFIATKSTTTGKYVNYFKAILDDYLTEHLKEYIIKNNVTFVFEVIDPFNDPHIVKYKNRLLVLLDVIENNTSFKKLPHREVAILANFYGFKPVFFVTNIYNYQELIEWKKEQQDKSVFYTDVEGYVLEDFNGHMWKFKTPYYSFWKRWRYLVEVIRKQDFTPHVKKKLHTKEDFIVWNVLQEENVELNQDIISIRSQIIRKCQRLNNAN